MEADPEATKMFLSSIRQLKDERDAALEEILRWTVRVKLLEKRLEDVVAVAEGRR